MIDWFKRSWKVVAGALGVIFAGVLAVVLSRKKKDQEPPRPPLVTPITLTVENPKPSTTYQETKAQPLASPDKVIVDLNKRYK